ncbi:unnamed protein product [Angiostrongylus costaricensis]|uniref:Uncharacterized protein n=1 Tax=Angiostrongylus costaricensis TaxID=334426 RepID=A0A0R3PDQ3_ANGCS|nr:unnamed protein product [Angiostrongylus costaricensis]
MLLVTVLAIFSTTAFGRYCVDDRKEWCRGHDIWGWCFHNKTDGRFNCDDDGFCSGQEQLKNKKSTGCFLRGNNTVCCCNEADGCNLGFIPITPKYIVGQQCTNTVEKPNEDLKIFKACDDPWCFAFLSAVSGLFLNSDLVLITYRCGTNIHVNVQDISGGLTTVQRGCRSRKTLMHHISKDEHEKHNNNTKWLETERLVGLPSCTDITWNAEYTNGTQSMCLDFNFMVSDEI